MRAILMVVAACAPMYVTAQETTAERVTAAAIAAMPVEGPLYAFVPEHWQIHVEAEGDLNGDGLADRALTVTPSDDDPANAQATAADDYYPAPDITVVLFAKGDGSFRRVGTNARLSTRSFDGRPHEMAIEKGVLSIRSNFGMGNATDVVYRFRLDKTTGELMLIGYDHESYSRAGVEDAMVSSENYLTGVRIETVREVDRRANAEGVYRRERSKRSKIKRYRVAFDDVDYDDDVENPMGRPFKATK
jgi:hypothetical protein